MRQLTRRAGRGEATLALGEKGRARELVSRHGWGLGWGRHLEVGTGSTGKAAGSRWKRKKSEMGPRENQDFGRTGVGGRRQILGAERRSIPGFHLFGLLSGSGPCGKGNLE